MSFTRFTLPLLLGLCGCHELAAEDSASCEREPACPDGFVFTSRLERALSPPISVPHGPNHVAVGDLEGTGDRQIYVATSTTITRLTGEGWTTATDLWTVSGTSMIPLLADLTGDGALDLVIGMPDSDDGAGQAEVFPGPITEPLTWDSPHFELQGTDGAGSALEAADLNGDGALDLKVEAHGAVWVKPGPILADDPFGSVGDSSWTWDAALTVSATVVDLNHNGGADVLFRSSAPGDECTGSATELRFASGPLTPGDFAVADAELLLVPATGANSSPWFDDVDGDGVADMLLVLDTGELAIYAGPIALGDSPATRFFTPGLAYFTGEFNGDGILDLAEQTYGADTPLVSFGPLAELPDDTLDTCAFAADEAWTAGSAFPDAGWVGDLDGDAIADAIVESTAEDGSGAIQLRLGAP